MERNLARDLLKSLIHQITKNITIPYICNILEERPKALLKMFLIDVDKVKLLRHGNDLV